MGDPIKIALGNEPATINGIQFSGHALDRMQRDGVMPSVVENLSGKAMSDPIAEANQRHYQRMRDALADKRDVWRPDSLDSLIQDLDALLALATVQHANQVVFTETPDRNGMARCSTPSFRLTWRTQWAQILAGSVSKG
jgi:hypothetical protein